MGFLSSALGIAGSVLGGTAGVVASGLGTYLNNREKQKATQRANDQAIELANTAHQREVADLKAAGLNPILSAHNSGSATPNMAVYDPENTSNSALASKRLKLDEKDILARIELNSASAEKQRADTKYVEQQTISEVLNQQLIKAKTSLTHAQTTQVNEYVDRIMPVLERKMGEEIEKIKDERTRISLLNRWTEMDIWQKREMVFIAKAQLTINKQQADSASTMAAAALQNAQTADFLKIGQDSVNKARAAGIESDTAINQVNTVKDCIIMVLKALR